MSCITPLTLKSPDGSASLCKTVVVPCGKCLSCLKTLRNQWAFRLYQESLCSTSAIFMTLTYGKNLTLGFGEDPSVTPNGYFTLNPEHVTNFLKKLRKADQKRKEADGLTLIPEGHHYPEDREYKHLKYYYCGEYGTTYQRPHYHLLLFNLHPHFIHRSHQMAKEIWTKGMVDIGTFTLGSINYVVNYIVQPKFKTIREDDDRHPEFRRSSQKLGLNYLTPDRMQMHQERYDAQVSHPAGFLMDMPRYYKQKIFSPSEMAVIKAQAKRYRDLDFDTLPSFIDHWKSKAEKGLLIKTPDELYDPTKIKREKDEQIRIQEKYLETVKRKL
jgi:hypothetical protein